MASSNASRIQSQLFAGVDTNDEILSLVNLLLDVLVAHGTDGSLPPAADVLGQLEAVASPNSQRALKTFKQLLNTGIDQGR